MTVRDDARTVLSTGSPSGSRLHKATYARDKRTGGYNIRISGPYPNRFAGKEVPVTTVKGGEHTEKLLRLLWSGIETSSEYGGTVGEAVALYSFEASPREDKQEELPF